MGKNYDLYSPYQRTIDNLKRRIRGYEKMKKDLTNQYRKSNKENQELKKQLEYLRSGEYLNQLKFERNMLEDVVNKGEVSKEDKEFIDMTHRNTELLEQQKEFIEWLESMLVSELDVFTEVKICDVLSKYKEIIGKDINVATKEM